MSSADVLNAVVELCILQVVTHPELTLVASNASNFELLCTVVMLCGNKQTRQKRTPIPTNAETEQMVCIVCSVPAVHCSKNNIML